MSTIRKYMLTNEANVGMIVVHSAMVISAGVTASVSVSSLNFCINFVAICSVARQITSSLTRNAVKSEWERTFQKLLA